MRRCLLLVVVACGPYRSADSTLVIDDKPAASPAEAAAPAKPADQVSTPSTAPAITAQLTIEQACARFETLSAAGCDWTQRFPPEFRQPGSCTGSLQTWVADPSLQLAVNCWALECGPAAQCMASLKAGAAAPAARTCGEEGTGPVVVDPATWAGRSGATAKKFSEVTSTQDKPIEVCGIEGELEWITRVRCNDGSNPFGSQAVANESRDSWLARGGRCNSILDRYAVKCPETTYQVYVDRYVCPRS